jgi:hypothetical protein
MYNLLKWILRANILVDNILSLLIVVLSHLMIKNFCFSSASTERYKFYSKFDGLFDEIEVNETGMFALMGLLEHIKIVSST